MSLHVALQMDPIVDVDINADTTFRLALEAQSRGHKLFYYRAEDLSFNQGRVEAVGHAVTVRNVQGDHVTMGAAERVDLSQMDVILLRQDPPFDMAYITNTHLLEHIHPATLVVNDPASVRNAPEKLLVTHFPDITPPTLITRDADAARAFRAEHKDIIIKPLFGAGGAGVFRLRPDDQNLNSLTEMFCDISREPFIVQAYLPDVRNGDKRIILVDGEPIGAINRVPAEGEARSNMHVGGVAAKVGLTKRDQEICERIGPTLRAQGLLLTGIDVIGDYITEINVTSPTGIQELERFDGTNTAKAYWDAIEAKRG